MRIKCLAQGDTCRDLTVESLWFYPLCHDRLFIIIMIIIIKLKRKHEKFVGLSKNVCFEKGFERVQGRRQEA